jgi:hypothetical protein
MIDGTFGKLVTVSEGDRLVVRARMPAGRRASFCAVADVLHDVVHATQANVLWQNGWGTQLGFRTFAEYRLSIPPIPMALLADDPRFPDLVLVDRRISLPAMRRLSGGSGFRADDRTYEDFCPPKRRMRVVYWMRAQDGGRNRSLSVHACARHFAPNEIGLNIAEAFALCLQKVNAARAYAMDLSNSRSLRGHVASLKWSRDGLELRPQSVHITDPNHGTASRRR